MFASGAVELVYNGLILCLLLLVVWWVVLFGLGLCMTACFFEIWLFVGLWLCFGVLLFNTDGCFAFLVVVVTLDYFCCVLFGCFGLVFRLILLLLFIVAWCELLFWGVGLLLVVVGWSGGYGSCVLIITLLVGFGIAFWMRGCMLG